MRILVVGSGAREHALCWRLSRDPGVDAGRLRPRQRRARPASYPTVAVDPADPEARSGACRTRADRPHRGRSRSSAGARHRRSVRAHEAARSSARVTPRRSSRPARRSRKTSWRATACRPRAIASAATPTKRSPRSAAASLGDAPVVKADGLAAGKGVVVAGHTRAKRKPRFAPRWSIARSAMPAPRVVLEERLEGPEVSFFVDRRRRARRAAGRGAGSQAHLRRRPRPEHRRDGRVCAEPARRRRTCAIESCARSFGPCSTG